MKAKPTIIQYWAGCPQSPNSKWLRILRTVHACAELGWNNVMVLSSMPADSSLVKPYTDIGCEIVLHPRAAGNLDVKCVGRTFRLLRQKKCDVFHCQNVHTSPLIAATLARVPVRIWSKLSMSADYEEGTTPTGLHRFQPTTKLSCMLAHRTLCISDRVRDELLKLNVSPSKLAVTPVPIDLDLYRNASADGPRAEWGLNPNHTLITAVGRAAKVKGWDLLLRAFATLNKDLPSTRLLLVGDIEKTKVNQAGHELLKLATELGINDVVTFAGKRNDIPRILAATDIFAMPSRSEGMGCALVEAVAASLPIVAADVGGIPNVITHRQNGLLFEREDVDGLTRAIATLIQDENLRKTLKNNAALTAKNYSLDKATDDMIALYKQLLTEPPHAASNELPPLPIQKTKSMNSTLQDKPIAPSNGHPDPPMARNEKPSICILAHFAYGAMTGGSTGHIGGVERQTSMTARWLAAQGYPVTMITWDEGQDHLVTIDDVRMIKVCRENDGLPGLRFFIPRWTSLVRALKLADADLYYQNCAESVTGQAAMWCRRNRKAFVFSTASNMDCETTLPAIKEWRVRALYRYGLRHADRLIVQTEVQRDMMREGFGLEAIVLPMPCPGPSEAEYVQPDRHDPATIIWVGRIIDIKRLEWFLDVAEALPHLNFKIVGYVEHDSRYARSLMKRAAEIPNVTNCGKVPRERMPGVYRQAAILCCTSEIEGLPNTFLEAWSHGVPVVTTFDPDGLVDERNLGKAAKDVSELVRGIDQLSKDPEQWSRASENARRHYLENHTPDAVLRRFEKVFLNTVDAVAKRNTK